jgi:hypothetical protein
MMIFTNPRLYTFLKGDFHSSDTVHLSLPSPFTLAVLLGLELKKKSEAETAGSIRTVQRTAEGPDPARHVSV